MKRRMLWTLGVLLGTAVCGQAQDYSQPAATAPSPKIVKTVTFANQTQAIPQTTIFTPADDGLFRVSIYLETITTNPSNERVAGFSPDLVATNDSGATQDQPGAGVISGFPVYGSLTNSSTSNVYFFRAKANTPMLFSNPLSGVIVPPYSYSVYIVIEQL